MLKLVAVVGIVAVAVILISRWRGPSPRELLIPQLEQEAQAESYRLSGSHGRPVRVTVTIDRIEPRRDPKYTLIAFVHFDCDGIEYERQHLRYDCTSERWYWGPLSPIPSTGPASLRASDPRRFASDIHLD